MARCILPLLLAVVSGVACGNDTPPRPAPPPAKEPIRNVAGDEDLRVLLAEVASARACAMMKGQFRALRAIDRPDVATGILWIRGCEVKNAGKQLTFSLTGAGWQWADKVKRKAGATFAVAQDVRFAVAMEIRGALDVAYDPPSHVLSVLFTPAKTPDVTFTPIGDLEVDAQGAWATTLGALGTVFGKSPDDAAEGEAKKEGTGEMKAQLADGLAVTIDLCTGLARFNLGRPGKGEMQPADVGETRRIPYEMHPGGLMVMGPYLAGSGMTVRMEVEAGAVRAAIMCRGEAERLAAAYADGVELPEVKSLAIEDFAGKGTLHVREARCPVDVVVRAIPDAKGTPARFRWQRPERESARSTGGPVIQCPRRPRSP